MRLFLVLLALFAIPSPRAEACSCADTPLAEHAKAATQVLLVRAGAPAKKGNAVKQTFTVLATLKGTATSQFVLDRQALAPCSSSYTDGEVAILFSSGGELDPCHGNLPLASQIDQLAAILDATGTKRGDAKAAGLEAALGVALAKYTHDRPRIEVAYAPLAKTSLRLGKTTLAVVGARKSKGAVVIAQALATDALTFVTGRYDREGLRFTVLLQGTTVVWSSIAER